MTTADDTLKRLDRVILDNWPTAQSVARVNTYGSGDAALRYEISFLDGSMLSIYLESDNG
jgi:hypothetical protein